MINEKKEMKILVCLFLRDGRCVASWNGCSLPSDLPSGQTAGRLNSNDEVAHGLCQTWELFIVMWTCEVNACASIVVGAFAVGCARL